MAIVVVESNAKNKHGTRFEDDLSRGTVVLESTCEKTRGNFSAAFAELDQEGANNLIEVIPLKHASAENLSRQVEAAMEHLIQIVKRDRAWEEDKARKQLVKFFEALGNGHAATVQVMRASQSAREGSTSPQENRP